jgi:hypothetical protein
MGVKITKRGREEQGGTVEVDHRLHGLLDIDGFRNVFLFDQRDARHLLDDGGTLGMRLVVAIVVLRADIDEADGQRRLRHGLRADQAGDGTSSQAGGGSLEEIAAVHGKEFGHRHAPCGSGPVSNGYSKVHAMCVPEPKALLSNRNFTTRKL